MYISTIYFSQSVCKMITSYTLWRKKYHFCMYERMYVCKERNLHGNTTTTTCMYVCVYVCISVCTMYLCIYTCMNVCMYLHTYIYTYVCTCMYVRALELKFWNWNDSGIFRF